MASSEIKKNKWVSGSESLGAVTHVWESMKYASPRLLSDIVYLFQTIHKHKQSLFALRDHIIRTINPVCRLELLPWLPPFTADQHVRQPPPQTQRVYSLFLCLSVL